MGRKFKNNDIIQHTKNGKFYTVVSDATMFKLDGVWYDGYTYKPNYECEIQMFMRKYSDMEEKFVLKNTGMTIEEMIVEQNRNNEDKNNTVVQVRKVAEDAEDRVAAALDAIQYSCAGVQVSIQEEDDPETLKALKGLQRLLPSVIKYFEQELK